MVPSSIYSNASYSVNLKNFLLTQKSIVRAITTEIEVLLTFIRFTMIYKTQIVFGDRICDHISYMRTSSCLLYVFYHDRTLLFIS